MPASAPQPAAHRKPAACKGCSLYERGHGFVPPDGDPRALIGLMGEGPGYDESAVGRPFIGAAGSMLERIFRRNNLDRSLFRIFNGIQCTPPGLELRGTSYELSALDHCRVHRDPVLNAGHKVIVAAGHIPLMTLLGLRGQDRIRVEEFHGTVHRDREDRFWVVPTFHPSYLQRGAHNLIGTVSFDLQLALEVARGQWQHEPIDPILDPPVEWFAAWVEMLEAAAAQDPEGVRVNCDTETPDKEGGKPENELGPDDTSYQIKRWNFAINREQGVTVPDDPAYWPLIKRVLELPCPHDWWNGAGYDWDRVLARGAQLAMLQQYDFMIGAHVLQSDVPLGLGFWAPFYSQYGAWKHLSGGDEQDKILYACLDGPQGYRTATGIIGDLIAQGQWRAFQEDCHELYHQALKPAQEIGILIDRPAVEAFHGDLEVKQRRLMHALQATIPDELRPLTKETATPPAEGQLHPSARTHNQRTGELLKSQPDAIKKDLYALSAVRVERQVTRLIKVCLTCGEKAVHAKHRCKDERGKPLKDAVAQIDLQEQPVVRWFWQEPFNPDSAPQVLGYLKFRGHKPGKDKHTKKDSANREALKRLAKTTKDPFYQTLLDYRAVKKVDSTYALPTLRRIAKDPEGRLHPIPTFRPSTMRLSYVSPNITNVVQDKGGKESLAAGFRRCVVAAPGCRLLEVDYSGIEAVETGWFIRDPRYLRLAKLGIHAYLTSHLLKRPADLGWSDADLAAYFKELKEADPLTYDKAKRCVHGTNYGLTPYGMAEGFPDLYKDEADAAKVQAVLFEVCPTLPTWHFALQQQAYETGFLGGPGEMMTGADNACYKPGYRGASPFNHPFGYKHWFWSVLSYKPITEKQRVWREKRKRKCVNFNGRWFAVDPGEDSKRVIAFFPQSTGSGVLKKAIRRLHTPDDPCYIGDRYYGRTVFRAPIHDSGLFEIPDRVWDSTVERILTAFQAPVTEQPMPKAWGMGAYLSIGVEAKAGHNWLDVEKVKIPGPQELGVSNEETYFGTEEIDEEDAQELGVVA